MNATDQKEVLALVREHFSGATDGDGPLVWNAVKGYDLADVRNALEQHRTEQGSNAWRPDINRVKALACNRWRDRYRDRQDALRIVDLIRRQNPTAYPPDVGDIPAVLAYFGRAWADVEADAADGPGRVAARVYILAHCRRALTELGISPAEADAEARTIVVLEPGERVMRVRLFQEMPLPGQTAWDATKALAKAELAQPAGA
jgi:hypothetical protein